MLENAGWGVARWPVGCFACAVRISCGDPVYAPNLANLYNVFCEACGPVAEAAVARKRGEVPVCESCGGKVALTGYADAP